MTGDSAAANAGAAQNQNQNQNQSPAGQQQSLPAQQPIPALQQGIQQNNQQHEFILSQEQFNARWAEKMAALEKELGMPLKDVKTFIEANKKPKPAAGETLSGADLKLAKMEALMLKGIPSRQIPVILEHFNIKGRTREEIDASIQALIDVKLLTIEAPVQQGNQQQTPKAAQGAGNSGVPGTNQPKVWTKAEVLALQRDNPAEYEKHRKEIMEQMSKGLIK